MKTLLILDVQNDFLAGGALPVPGGNAVVPVINRLQADFDLVVATQDWHPANHGSFAANHPGKIPGDTVELAGLSQVLGPVHCVQHTPGADFAPELDRTRWEHVCRKGTDPTTDSYSGFFDHGHRHPTELENFLRMRGAEELWLAGLATDDCVKHTALDARAAGFRVHLFPDACRSLELRPGDTARALEEMALAGVVIESLPGES